jgi:hypothetical protein
MKLACLLSKVSKTMEYIWLQKEAMGSAAAIANHGYRIS